MAFIVEDPANSPTVTDGLLSNNIEELLKILFTRDKAFEKLAGQKVDKSPGTNLPAPRVLWRCPQR